MESTLSGQLNSANGPVAGGFVATTGPSGQAGTVSSANGEFTLTVPAGTYQLAANAQGFLATVQSGVVVTATTTQDLTLTASGAVLAPAPVFGGGRNDVAADGKSGVFYAMGGGAGQLYRTVDYGGTWTQVTVSRDDPTNGLSQATNPDQVVTSGFPGEVAVDDPAGVFYSTDFGVTWSTMSRPGPGSLYWGHAGTKSVMLWVATSPYAMYVADMGSTSPNFVEMTTPYAPSGQPIAVSDGGDQPWLATVDSSGELSVFPLDAQAAPPAAYISLTGFPTTPIAVGMGGEARSGRTSVGSRRAVRHRGRDDHQGADKHHVSFTGDRRSDLCSLAPRLARTGSGHAEHRRQLWRGIAGQLLGSGLRRHARGERRLRQRHPGDRCRLRCHGHLFGNRCGGPAPCRRAPRAPQARRSDSDGNPKLPDPTTADTVNAGPGMDPASAGVSANGITAPSMTGATLGPTGGSQLAMSAEHIGGVASADGGASYHFVTYEPSVSVAWWQGATGTWMLFGASADYPNGNGVSGVENWTVTTPAVSDNNVSGSDPTTLGLPDTQWIYSITGVPGSDTAFVGSGQALYFGAPEALGGALTRVTVGSGPSFSDPAAIGKGVITSPVLSPGRLSGGWFGQLYSRTSCSP